MVEREGVFAGKMRPRVVYYTRPGYFDPAFSLLGPLSAVAEVHLIVEIAPEGRGIGAFCVPKTPLPSGLLLAKALPEWLPAGIQARLENLASFHLAVYNTRRAFDPRGLLTSWQVARYIDSIRPQVLHFDEASSRAVALPYLLPYLPLVLSVHDSKAHLGESGGRFEFARRLFLRRVRALIFHSQYAQRTFPRLPVLQSGGVQTRVIPLGIYDVFRDVGAVALTEGDDACNSTVLCFGRVSPYKGIETLLAAAPLVARQVPHFRLVIAGAPVPGYRVPITPELESDGHCEYRLRPIPLNETRSLFEQCAVVVLPYIEATQSGVVATAYAFHKPVVATVVGGLPEMVEDGVTGRLVPPRDPVALARAIVELLRDSGKRQRMSDAIRRKEHGELSSPRLVDMTLDVYRSALIGTESTNPAVEFGNTTGNH